MKIAFLDIDVSGDGWLRCSVQRDTVEQLEIKLPYSFRIAPDVLAAALGSLCGTAYESVYFDLPLGENTVKQLEDSLGAQVGCLSGVDRRRRVGRETGLNFSGGFDSLAARALMPSAHLISLDFGGRFSRERHFFEQFSPLVFETNLVSLGLNRQSWQFMNIGSILLRDELDLGFYSFGSIMAGALPRLFRGPLDQKSGGIAVANNLGMTLRNPVAGLSEIASLLLVGKTAPELLAPALQSVALPSEDKFRRKFLMLRAVCQRIGLPLALGQDPVGEAKQPWGHSFANDLASLYVMQVLGPDAVNDAYAGGVPGSIIASASGLKLNFMERVNPHAYGGVDAETASDWYRQLLGNGILPFYRDDWREVEEILGLLKP